MLKLQCTCTRTRTLRSSTNRFSKEGGAAACEMETPRRKCSKQPRWLVRGSNYPPSSSDLFIPRPRRSLCLPVPFVHVSREKAIPESLLTDRQAITWQSQGGGGRAGGGGTSMTALAVPQAVQDQVYS